MTDMTARFITVIGSIRSSLHRRNMKAWTSSAVMGNSTHLQWPAS